MGTFSMTSSIKLDFFEHTEFLASFLNNPDIPFLAALYDGSKVVSLKLHFEG